MGILDQILAPFKSGAKQAQSGVTNVAKQPGRKAQQAANKAKSKGRAVSQAPGRAMQQKISQGTSKANSEMNKRTKI